MFKIDLITDQTKKTNCRPTFTYVSSIFVLWFHAIKAVIKQDFLGHFIEIPLEDNLENKYKEIIDLINPGTVGRLDLKPNVSVHFGLIVLMYCACLFNQTLLVDFKC